MSRVEIKIIHRCFVNINYPLEFFKKIELRFEICIKA